MLRVNQAGQFKTAAADQQDTLGVAEMCLARAKQLYSMIRGAIQNIH